MRSRRRRESLQSQGTHEACLTVLPRSSMEIKGFESQQINFAEAAGKRARRQGADRKGDRVWGEPHPWQGGGKRLLAYNSGNGVILWDGSGGTQGAVGRAPTPAPAILGTQRGTASF